MDLEKEMEELDPIEGEEERISDERVLTPEQLLKELVDYFGTNDFMIMTYEGWNKTLQVLEDSSDEEIIAKLNSSNIAVIPLNLTPAAPVEEESVIITPDNMPKKGSKIITDI